MLKTITYLSIIFINVSLAYAQPVIEWEKTLNGGSIDYSTSICKTSDGGSIVSGYTYSSFPGYHGGGDAWLTKLDDLGNIQWMKCYGGAGGDYARSVQQTSDGGYVFVGSISGDGGDVSGAHGGADFWVVKTDNAGTIQWQKCLGGSTADVGRMIKQSADGGFFIAGHSNSTNGDVPLNHGGTDILVMKLDAAHNLVWSKTFGGSDEEAPSSIEVTSDGGCIVTAGTSSTNGDITVSHGSQDGWILKLDALGNLQWQKSLGGSYIDVMFSIKQLYDGSYIVAGETSSTDGDIAFTHGDADMWLVKLNIAGNIQWEKTYGGAINESAHSISLTSDGGYILAGHSGSHDAYVTGIHPTFSGSIAYYLNDYWIVKVNHFGAKQWERCYGGQYHEDAKDIQEVSSGEYVIVGDADSNDGDITAGSTANNNVWVLKLQVPGVDIDEQEKEAFDFKIQPNPSNGIFTITLENILENGRLEIYNVLGDLVFTENMTAELSKEINLSAIPTGFYFVKVSSAENTVCKKIIIE